MLVSMRSSVVTRYKSKLALEVAQYEEQLKFGTVLALDPSSGSAGSLPGFALFKAGQLVDAGLITIPRSGGKIANRLWQLRESLLTEFPKPDLLAIEWIAPVFPAKMKGGQPQYLHKSASALMKSVGAIMSVWNAPVVEPSPTTWHRLVDEVLTPLGLTYVKSDTRDAVAIGWSALVTLARVLGEADPPMPYFLMHGKPSELGALQ
jgi:hypothetical protein